MSQLIEGMKNLGTAVGLFVLIEVGLMAAIILFCIIREFVRGKKK